MNLPDVCFFEAFEEEAAALRRYLPPDVRADFTAKTIQEAGPRTPPARIISIRTQSLIPPGWAAAVGGILSRSTGFDHLTAYREATGVAMPCGYLPLYCARAVAEQALLLWLGLLRRLPLQLRQFQEFHRDGLTGRECDAKTLLVVGVGNIGHEVARVATGVGMRVLGVDLVRKWPEIDYVRIEEGIRQADVIVSAMNLTSLNRGYFNRELLAKVRRGTLFVNISRGELAMVSDLLELLDDGHLGGVGLDVYDAEPELAVSLRTGQPSANPTVQATLELARRPDVICTPHNAFNTAESVDRKAEQSVQQVRQFLATGTFLWPIP
ncbi:MAG: hydroxyacid dehydrogenase [Lentisphaerae bacterium RIFOXYB12_FULL_65_16]|nr:MAG: hydroxyacid dehydrogenase [Lentisphaerae bacterium RIFOXYA12_64_32]OGV84810.1 MAG: hydroxyacid dehydrogenase [Lentisphaerae bacterium RIFOXYB12_FULL_65_16]